MSARRLASPSTVPLHSRYAHPWRFFLWATAIPWAVWGAAVWTSRHPEYDLVTAALGIAGLAAPMGVVAWMTRGQPELRRDILRRLDLRGVPWRWIAFSVLVIQAAVFVATAASVLLGYSPDQFGLRGAVTFSAGVLPGWVILVLAPVLEELAWHSYATDALHTRYTVFGLSMVFVVVWVLWHLPLAFIEGSSQQQTAEQGWLHTLNFPLSMIPFVLLMNWMYYRTGRNITLTVLFHLGANLSTQVFATHPDTEIIATAVLLVLTAAVLIRDRALFFAPPGTAPAAVIRC